MGFTKLLSLGDPGTGNMFVSLELRNGVGLPECSSLVASIGRSARESCQAEDVPDAKVWAMLSYGYGFRAYTELAYSYACARTVHCS